MVGGGGDVAHRQNHHQEKCMDIMEYFVVSFQQIGLAGPVERPYLANGSEHKYSSKPSPMTTRFSPTETTRFHVLEGRLRLRLRLRLIGFLCLLHPYFCLKSARGEEELDWNGLVYLFTFHCLFDGIENG